MFENSSSWQQYKEDRPKVIRAHLGYVPDLDTQVEDREAKTRLRVAILIAVVLHVGLAIVTLPQLTDDPLYVGPQRDVYVVQQVKFKPPPPQAKQQRPKQEKKTKKIPIPDPTPDEPEPIVLEDIELPDVDLSDVDAVVFGAESIPSIPGGMGRWPMKVGGGVLPPQKIYTPQPVYTEEARLARIQGVVILEAIIDEKGAVQQVKVLKGLPEGLSESAVKTAKQWTFKPATLDGRPVPVYFNLTVRFSLQ
jgi:TonB family protein